MSSDAGPLKPAAQPSPGYPLQDLCESPASKGWIAGFVEGFTAPVHGVRVLLRFPQLWRYAVLPLLMNLIITVVVGFVLVLLAGWLMVNGHAWLVEGQSGWLLWLGWLGEVVLTLLSVAVCVVAAVLLWHILSSVLCGYFYGLLAHELELKLGLDKSQLRDVSLTNQTLDALLDIGLLVAVNLLLLGFHLIPLAGSLVALAAGVGFTSFVLGVDYVGFSLSLRGTRRWRQYRTGRKHLPQCIGLGLAVLLMELIPIAGAALLITAAAGGVVLHRRLERQNA